MSFFPPHPQQALLHPSNQSAKTGCWAQLHSLPRHLLIRVTLYISMHQPFNYKGEGRTCETLRIFSQREKKKYSYLTHFPPAPPSSFSALHSCPELRTSALTSEKGMGERLSKLSGRFFFLSLRWQNREMCLLLGVGELTRSRYSPA